MDVFEAIESRRSIRKYKSDQVSEGDLRKLLEVARIAPSSSNIQSWKFRFVTDSETRTKLKEAANNQKFVGEAPLVIACCLDFEAFDDKTRRSLDLVLRGAVRPSMEMVLHSLGRGSDAEPSAERKVVNGVMNVTIAADHIVLAATALGLGTCWVRAFDAEAVARILTVPASMRVLCLITVGYPDQAPSARPRKEADEIVF